MKQILILLSIFCVSIIKAGAIVVFHDSNPQPDLYANQNIDSIKITPNESSADLYDYHIYTKYGEFVYPENRIDSIRCNIPHIAAITRNVDIPAERGSFFVEISKLNSGFDNIFVDGDIWQLGGYGDAYYHIIEFYIENYITESRNGKLTISGDTYSDEVTLNFTGKPFFVKEGTSERLFDNLNSEGMSLPDTTEYTLFPTLPVINLVKYDCCENFMGWDWRKDDNGNIILIVPENETYKPRRIEFEVQSENFTTESYRFYQSGKFRRTAEEHLNALRDFYNSTSVHELNTNWFTDKPLSEWEWINTGHSKDHVVGIHTGGGQYTGITGTLPSSFEVFLDDLSDEHGLDLFNCALYGEIPENIRHHPRWQQYGWNIIPQMVWVGGGFEGELGLHLDDGEVADFVNDEATTVMDVLAKNKLTWIFNAGAVDMIDGISDERVNKYLDYKDKGFGVVVTVGGFWDVPYDDYRNYVVEQQDVCGLPKEILWTKGFDKGDAGSYGSMSIVDEKGNLLWYSDYDYDLPDGFYLDKIDKVCREYLGEPVEHEPYVSHPYESTDYSRDGEVMILQEASVGKGIDIVLTGDAFVDTDLGEGGVFEIEMEQAMEKFFEVEPYKTLRERFNVYAVKAVSKNNFRGSEHAFNNDNNKVMEYVSKVPDVDMENVTVVVIQYNPNFQMFMSGYTEMFDSGASIAYLESGNASNIIVHEAGGHGFAKLLDEYISPGYEENAVPEENLDSFREWIADAYHSRGWGMNVSTSDDPQLAPWKDFLVDERYAGEVGIYQGAWFWPKDLWRSSENSMMNTDYSTFNAPSRRAIYKRVMTLSEEEGWTYNHEEFVKFDKEIMSRTDSNVKGEKKSESPTFIHKSPRIIKTDNDGKLIPVESPVGFRTIQTKIPVSRSVVRDRRYVCGNK